MSWSAIAEIINKLFPSRKGALVDQLNALTVKYQKALDEGRDTDAAVIKKQLDQMRKKAEIAGGEV
jgi:hypothetical protein